MKKNKEPKLVTVDIKVTIEASEYNRETAYCKWYTAKRLGNIEDSENNEAIYRAICEAQGDDADKYLNRAYGRKAKI